MKNKISIIIPTYNSEKYVIRCLDSLKQQTIPPYEIIFINDGSTDNTLNVLKQYEGLKLDIISTENKGQGSARNLALNKAKGDYIWFIDSDDTISADAIEKLTNIITKESTDVVNFDYQVTNLEGDIKHYTRFKNQPYIVNGSECSILLANMPYYTVNNLYNREFLLKNNIRYGEGYIYEDCEFWVKVAITANKVIFLKDELYQIVKENDSTTNSNMLTDKHWTSFLKAAEACLDYAQNNTHENIGYLNKYLLNRFFTYYTKRTPKSNKKKFLYRFVDLMSKYDLRQVKHKTYNKLIKYKIYKNKSYCEFYIFTKLYCLKKYKKW